MKVATVGVAVTGVLVAILGAIGGIAAGVGVTYVFLESADESDALVWLACLIFFCTLGIPLGIGAALGFWGYGRERWAKRS
jgi:hypothetical protein